MVAQRQQIDSVHPAHARQSESTLSIALAQSQDSSFFTLHLSYAALQAYTQ